SYRLPDKPLPSLRTRASSRFDNAQEVHCPGCDSRREMKGRLDPFPDDPKVSPLRAGSPHRLGTPGQEMSFGLEVFAPALRCKAARCDSIVRGGWARCAGCIRI